ncbi:MAG: hypothetical protein IPL53_21150 [Ignavibacteria bacterium]|nr:hypothetical protein [Ignavibacteria bacterium]
MITSNGTGTININPTLGSIGTYNGITLTATDNIGATSTISFHITIIDKTFLRCMLISLMNK